MANPSPHPPAQGPAPLPAGPLRTKGSRLSSGAVALGTMGLLSTLVLGFCAAQDRFAQRVTADCVDLATRDANGSYQVVDERECDHASGSHVSYSSHGAYSWYYGGARQAGRVLSGTTIRPSGAHISSRAGSVIQRGGFGGRGSGGS